MDDPFSQEELLRVRSLLDQTAAREQVQKATAAAQHEHEVTDLKRLVRQFLERADQLGVKPNELYESRSRKWVERRAGLFGQRVERDWQATVTWSSWGYWHKDDQASNSDWTVYYDILQNGLVFCWRSDNSTMPDCDFSSHRQVKTAEQALRDVMLEILASPDRLYRPSRVSATSVPDYDPEYMF